MHTWVRVHLLLWPVCLDSSLPSQTADCLWAGPELPLLSVPWGIEGTLCWCHILPIEDSGAVHQQTGSCPPCRTNPQGWGAHHLIHLRHRSTASLLGVSRGTNAWCCHLVEEASSKPTLFSLPIHWEGRHVSGAPVWCQLFLYCVF